jgi:hypothetical protein
MQLSIINYNDPKDVFNHLYQIFSDTKILFNKEMQILFLESCINDDLPEEISYVADDDSLCRVKLIKRSVPMFTVERIIND